MSDSSQEKNVFNASKSHDLDIDRDECPVTGKIAVDLDDLKDRKLLVVRVVRFSARRKETHRYSHTHTHIQPATFDVTQLDGATFSLRKPRASTKLGKKHKLVKDPQAHTLAAQIACAFPCARTETLELGPIVDDVLVVERRTKKTKLSGATTTIQGRPTFRAKNLATMERAAAKDVGRAVSGLASVSRPHVATVRGSALRTRSSTLTASSKRKSLGSSSPLQSSSVRKKKKRRTA